MASPKIHWHRYSGSTSCPDKIGLLEKEEGDRKPHERRPTSAEQKIKISPTKEKEKAKAGITDQEAVN